MRYVTLSCLGVALVLMFALTGCQNAGSFDELGPVAPPTMEVDPIFFGTLGDPATDMANVSALDPARQALNISSASEAEQAMREWRRLQRQDASLAELEAAAVEVLAAEVSARARWIIVSSMCHRMLRRHLQEGSGNVGAIARYTELLVAVRHPHAELILEALSVLQDTWPERKVAEAARLTADAALHLLSSECAACEGDIRTLGRAYEEALQGRERAILDAIAGLEELAQIAS